MKKYWKVFGVAALVVGIIYYPALKIYQYLAKAKRESRGEDETVHVKRLFPSYRGVHKPHHRHAHNGDGKANLT